MRKFRREHQSAKNDTKLLVRLIALPFELLLMALIFMVTLDYLFPGNKPYTQIIGGIIGVGITTYDVIKLVTRS